MEPFSFFPTAPSPPFPSSSSSALLESTAQLAEDGDQWTFEENKRFETALAEFDLGAPDLFDNIQTRVPGKTLWEIKKHLDDLFEDIEKIETGIIPIPNYKTTPTQVKSNPRSQPRKKGVIWTEEEHKLFLQGLKIYGKGDWKSISRHCVMSRNPTQVASHAQKYFLRLQNSAESEQNANGECSTSNNKL
ncbi:putative transcription factor MYB-HB-like family [Rosa chinensis]|uniref:Putative transcription factor MYB-HB-like family n=1 Tax=Rosa chinensis TaxID=74649 RepID=A0A2P6RL60_ROSCH|nr:transcription factor DIVARICATA [Rosa chinensis]PRQ47176.1 putative transcription factor MYB-HB-like family [Rosa chinensis]